VDPPDPLRRHHAGIIEEGRKVIPVHATAKAVAVLSASVRALRSTAPLAIVRRPLRALRDTANLHVRPGAATADPAAEVVAATARLRAHRAVDIALLAAAEVVRLRREAVEAAAEIARPAVAMRQAEIIAAVGSMAEAFFL
jgi:hypothetical protein